MATNYEKVNWIDRVDEGNKYTIEDNSDGTKSIKYAGKVTTHGTELKAEAFNKMDEGIYQNNQDIKVLETTTKELKQKVQDIKTYKSGSGIEVLEDDTINHTNKVTADTIGSKSDTTIELNSEDTFDVPWADYDGNGHITTKGTKTFKLPSIPSEVGKTYTASNGIEISSDDVIRHTNKVEAGTIGDESLETTTLDFDGTFYIPWAKYDENGHITSKGNKELKLPTAPSTGKEYTAEKGIEISESNVIGHTNNVTADTIGTESTTATSLNFGDTINIPYAKYDENGHITSKGNSEFKLPDAPETGKTYTATDGINISDSDVISHTNKVEAGTAGDKSEGNVSLNYGDTFNIPWVDYDGNGHITTKGNKVFKLPESKEGKEYTAEKGIEISESNVIGHTNNITADTIGEKAEEETSLDYGTTFDVPWADYDGNGHIINKGTKTFKLPNKVDSKSTIVKNITLNANSWNSSNATYSITDSDIKENSVVILDFQNSSTLDQINSASNAKIIGTNQIDGSIVLKAFGVIPAINIDITMAIISN